MNRLSMAAFAAREGGRVVEGACGENYSSPAKNSAVSARGQTGIRLLSFISSWNGVFYSGTRLASRMKEADAPARGRLVDIRASTSLTVGTW